MTFADCSGKRISVAAASDQNQKIESAVFFALLTGVLFVSMDFRPADISLFPLCIFRGITGIPCPGCGMTRAFLLIGQGDVIAAFRMNPAGPIVFLLVIALWVEAAIALFSGRRVSVFLTKQEYILLISPAVCVMVAVWAYNIFFNNHI